MEPADGGKKYFSINAADDSDGKDPKKLRGFWPVFILFNIFLVGSLALVGVWRGQYEGGFDWSTKKTNFHILFMCLGFLAMYGYGMVTYRLLRQSEKMTAKILHTILLLLALIFAGIGLNRVWGSNNLHSMHSWIGFSTVLLFALQWLMGLVTFLVPGLSNDIKGWYKPNHVFWGVAIFACACAAILTGAMEQASGVEGGSTESYIINTFGLGVLATGISVAYLTCNADYARV